MHCGGDFSPHIVVSAGVELQVNGTWGGTGTNGYERKVSDDVFSLTETDVLDFAVASVIVICLRKVSRLCLAIEKHVIEHVYALYTGDVVIFTPIFRGVITLND